MIIYFGGLYRLCQFKTGDTFMTGEICFSGDFACTGNKLELAGEGCVGFVPGRVLSLINEYFMR